MQTADIIQIVVVGPTLFFIAYQAVLQRRQVRNQSEIQSYNLYHLLVQQYLDLLRRADQDPELNCIWEKPDPERAKVLDEAQQETWGAWHAMTNTEKRCYRLVRYALETFEQTHQLHKRGWIDAETWDKWRAWLDIWRGARYFDYVVEDTRPRLIRSFVQTLDALPEHSRNPSATEG